MTVAVPLAMPAKTVMHLPALRVQVAPTVPTAVFDEVKLTAPEGVFEAVVVSVTVAVQVEVPPGAIELGVHETAVEVLSTVTLCVTVAPWMVSERGVPPASFTETHVLGGVATLFGLQPREVG